MEVELDEDEGEDAVEVWDVNWESLTAFLACSTQWRPLAGLSRLTWTGLDYAGVDVVLNRRDCGTEIFDDVQVMEIAALGAFAEAD